MAVKILARNAYGRYVNNADGMRGRRCFESTTCVLVEPAADDESLKCLLFHDRIFIGQEALSTAEKKPHVGGTVYEFYKYCVVCGLYMRFKRNNKSGKK